MTTADIQSAPSLVDAVGNARTELLRLHRMVHDIRLHNAMTIAFGAVLSLCGVVSVVYGCAQILGFAARGPIAPWVLVATAASLVAITIMFTLRRLDGLSIVLGAMEAEAGELEVAVHDAEARAKALLAEA